MFVSSLIWIQCWPCSEQGAGLDPSKAHSHLNDTVILYVQGVEETFWHWREQFSTRRHSVLAVIYLFHLPVYQVQQEIKMISHLLVQQLE